MLKPPLRHLRCTLNSAHRTPPSRDTAIQLEEASPHLTPLSKRKVKRKEQLTDSPHFKRNQTTVNWLGWKDLNSKPGLPFCSWTVCTASWNSPRWASGWENLELGQSPPSAPATLRQASCTPPPPDKSPARWPAALCSALISGSAKKCEERDQCHHKKKPIVTKNYERDTEVLLGCPPGTWADGCCAIKDFFTQ